MGQVGGAILGLELRAQLDAGVAHQAATAAACCERASRSGAPAPRSVQGVRLAAMRALLASVLAPCTHRPPFIAHALHLLRQARFTGPALILVPVCQLCVHLCSCTQMAAVCTSGMAVAISGQESFAPQEASAVMFTMPARSAVCQQPVSCYWHAAFLRTWQCRWLDL